MAQREDDLSSEDLSIEAIEFLETLVDLEVHGLLELDESSDEPRFRPTELGIRIREEEERRRAG